MNEIIIDNTLKDISKTLKALQKDLHKLTLQNTPKLVKEDKKEPDEMIFFPAALLPELRKDINNHLSQPMVLYTVQDLKMFLNVEADARKLRMTEKYFKPDDNKRFWDKMPEFIFVNSEEVAINLATAERIQ